MPLHSNFIQSNPLSRHNELKLSLESQLNSYDDYVCRLFHEIFFDMYNHQQANGKFQYVMMHFRLNSGQEAFAKYFAVDFDISLLFFFSFFFHVICTISNFDFMYLKWKAFVANLFY